MQFPREPLLPTTTKVQAKNSSSSTLPLLILLLLLGLLLYVFAPGHTLDRAVVGNIHNDLKNSRPTHRTRPDAWREEKATQKLLEDSVEDPPMHTDQGSTVIPEGMYSLNAENIDGVLQPLSDYAGNVSIVVNVASYCGYTDSNYKGLEKLYQKYKSRGLVVLAFPCNQFGGQEPKPNEEIKAFAASQYNVTFPIFAKVDVNGENTHPVYSFLKQHLPAEIGGAGLGTPDLSIKWNFEKFLVDRHGYPQKLFASRFDEQALESDLLPLLAREI